MTESVKLSDFITAVRQELQAAHDLNANEPLRFSVESVEMDVVVDVEETKQGGGNLDLKVVGLGLGGHVDKATMRHAGSAVHLVLTAKDKVDRKYQVSADRTHG